METGSSLQEIFLMHSKYMPRRPSDALRLLKPGSPFPHTDKHGFKGPSKFSQFVFNFRWHLWINDAIDDSVCLKLP